MESPLVWRTSWKEQDTARMVGGFIMKILFPGLFLVFFGLIESAGWGPILSMMIGIFLFFPYVCIMTLIFLYRLFTGGPEQEVSLSLVRGDHGDAYRLDGKWSLKAVVGESACVVEFLPQEVEGFLRETPEVRDGLVSWYRVVLWQKKKAPTILFEKVPSHVAVEALDWLHAKTGTKPPVF